ncbi:MAG: DinB family protein [Pseudomonadota bacterium]
MKAHFEMMAGYNAWANRQLFAAVAERPAEERGRDLGAAFGSLFGTLNHLAVADLIWLARLRGQRPPPFGLDHVLHDDFAELTAARRVLDDDIIRYVDGLTGDGLAGEIAYTRVTRPEPVRQPLTEALAHFFNHQTHHRGQAHALLTRLTGNAPALDLIFYQREAT